jgi:hypothetical protein
MPPHPAQIHRIARRAPSNREPRHERRPLELGRRRRRERQRVLEQVECVLQRNLQGGQAVPGGVGVEGLLELLELGGLAGAWAWAAESKGGGGRCGRQAPGGIAGDEEQVPVADLSIIDLQQG